MQNLFAPVELKDIRHDLTHWRNIANTMAADYPKYDYAVVETFQGDYVCIPITAKFDRDVIYKTGHLNMTVEQTGCA